MLVVANRLRVAEGYEREFLQLFDARIDAIRDRSGLQRVEILQPVDADAYVVQAYWESREAFEKWRNSDDFRAAHADLPSDMFVGSNRLDIYELAVSSGRP